MSRLNKPPGSFSEVIFILCVDRLLFLAGERAAAWGGGGGGGGFLTSPWLKRSACFFNMAARHSTKCNSRGDFLRLLQGKTENTKAKLS